MHKISENQEKRNQNFKNTLAKYVNIFKAKELKINLW